MNEHNERPDLNESAPHEERQPWQQPEVETFAARDVYAVLTTSNCGDSGSVALGGDGCIAA
jgi:hypothetical protein